MIGGEAVEDETLDEPGVRRYRVPGGTAQGELNVQGSIFIGTAGRATDQQSAQGFVEQIRQRYPDATHHAWAYRLTPGPQALIGSSDDGEPGGTAGRPMLAVLKGSGLYEVVVVGTRYFGGRKLGTGGLVRAYSGAARAALANLAVETRELHRVGRISVDYGLYGRLEYLLPRCDAQMTDEVFAEKVTLTILVPEERAAKVVELLRELTNGRLQLHDHWLGYRYLAATDSS